MGIIREIRDSANDYISSIGKLYREQVPQGSLTPAQFFKPPWTNVTELETGILAASPVGYWKMDDLTATAVDSSGNGRDGTHSGYTSLASQLGGDGGMYALFDHTTPTPGLTVAADSAFQIATGGGISAFLLARIDATDGNQSPQLIGTTNSSVQRNWRMRAFDATRLSGSTYTVTGSSTARQRIEGSGAGTVASATWQSFAFTVASTTAFPNVYLNGSLVGSTSGTGTGGDTSYPLRVGHWYTNFGRISGAFAHVAVFPGALTAQDIADLHAAAVTDGWTF